MSFKFDIYRCNECAAVLYDPQQGTTEEGDGVPKFPCPTIRRLPDGTLGECPGTMHRFALQDSDSYNALYDNFHGLWKD